MRSLGGSSAACSCWAACHGPYPALRVLGSGWRRHAAPAGKFQPIVFLWIWVIFIGVFFSLSDSKLMPYILPVMPALALLIAALPPQTLRRDFLITAMLTIVMAIDAWAGKPQLGQGDRIVGPQRVLHAAGKAGGAGRAAAGGLRRLRAGGSRARRNPGCGISGRRLVSGLVGADPGRRLARPRLFGSRSRGGA